MWWRNVQINEYDLQAMMYQIICAHHRLHISNGNKQNSFKTNKIGFSNIVSYKISHCSNGRRSYANTCMNMEQSILVFATTWVPFGVWNYVWWKYIFVINSSLLEYKAHQFKNVNLVSRPHPVCTIPEGLDTSFWWDITQMLNKEIKKSFNRSIKRPAMSLQPHGAICENMSHMVQNITRNIHTVPAFFCSDVVR